MRASWQGWHQHQGMRGSPAKTRNAPEPMTVAEATPAAAVLPCPAVSLALSLSRVRQPAETANPRQLAKMQRMGARKIKPQCVYWNPTGVTCTASAAEYSPLTVTNALLTMAGSGPWAVINFSSRNSLCSAVARLAAASALRASASSSISFAFLSSSRMADLVASASAGACKYQQLMSPFSRHVHSLPSAQSHAVSSRQRGRSASPLLCVWAESASGVEGKHTS